MASLKVSQMTAATTITGCLLPVAQISGAAYVSRRATPSSNPGAAAAILASDTAGKLQLEGLGLGAALPAHTMLYLNKTFTDNAPVGGAFQYFYFGQNGSYVLQPAGDSLHGLYLADALSVIVAPTNTHPIYLLEGFDKYITLQGTGNVSIATTFSTGMRNKVAAPGSVGQMKASYVWADNQGDVSTLYGGEYYLRTTGGTVGLARTGRFHINVEYDAAVALNPVVTSADVVYASAQNKGDGGHTATIGTLCGYAYDLSNGVGGIIPISYGLRIGAPSNLGTIGSHIGIYLGDQTVAGANPNFAVYVAGGKSFFGGNVGIGTAVFGTSAAKVLGLSNVATAPADSVDMAHLYCADVSPGNAALAVWQEMAPYAGVGVASTTRIPVVWNGATYYLLATTVA